MDETRHKKMKSLSHALFLHYHDENDKVWFFPFPASRREVFEKELKKNLGFNSDTPWENAKFKASNFLDEGQVFLGGEIFLISFKTRSITFLFPGRFGFNIAQDKIPDVDFFLNYIRRYVKTTRCCRTMNYKIRWTLFFNTDLSDQIIHKDIDKKDSKCWLNIIIPVTKEGKPTQFFFDEDEKNRIAPFLEDNSYFYIFPQHMFHRGVGESHVRLFSSMS